MEDTNPSFLGRGWAMRVRPGTRSQGIAFVEEEDDILEALHIILRTEPGERLMRPDFGTGLRNLINRPNTSSTHALAKHRVEEAIVQWEPRVHVDRVHVSARPGGVNAIDIEIDYTIRKTNTFYNLVYPFYLKERKL